MFPVDLTICLRNRDIFVDKTVILPYIPAVGTYLIPENHEIVGVANIELVISTGLTYVWASTDEVEELFDLAADHGYRLVNDLPPRGEDPETDESIYAKWDWWVNVRGKHNAKIPENLRLMMEKAE